MLPDGEAERAASGLRRPPGGYETAFAGVAQGFAGASGIDVGDVGGCGTFNDRGFLRFYRFFRGYLYLLCHLKVAHVSRPLFVDTGCEISALSELRVGWRGLISHLSLLSRSIICKTTAPRNARRSLLSPSGRDRRPGAWRTPSLCCRCSCAGRRGWILPFGSCRPLRLRARRP